MIGLKEFIKTYRDSSSKYKLKELCWQLRYAWQRAWRGYDDVEVFDLSFKFIERIVPILKDYKKNNVALFTDRKTSYILTEEETDEILDEMISLFENSDANTWIEKTNYDSSNKEDLNKICEYEQKAWENKKKGLALFVKWFDNLWY
jgi:hypothetical protein